MTWYLNITEEEMNRLMQRQSQYHTYVTFSPDRSRLLLPTTHWALAELAVMRGIDLVGMLTGQMIEIKGHLWKCLGLEDTTGWNSENIQWARRHYRCQRCDKETKIFGVPASQWAANERACPKRPRWWRK